jgi:hypothetical protein
MVDSFVNQPAAPHNSQVNANEARAEVIYGGALWTREEGKHRSRSFFIFFIAVHAKK